MTIGVLKESLPETRVSLLPEHITILKKLNVNVIVESMAGENAFAKDEKLQYYQFKWSTLKKRY